MQAGKQSIVQKLLYEENKEFLINQLSKITDTDILFCYIWNYNWNNGFSIPMHIICNKYCDLSTALLTFYRADGISVLLDKDSFLQSRLNEWEIFLVDLHKKLLNNSFIRPTIEFCPPLTKIQKFKIKKQNSDLPDYFIEGCQGKKLNIPDL